MKSFFSALSIALWMLSVNIFASETQINSVQANKLSEGKYNFSVTLTHADKSWDHYANVWQVKTLDGRVLAKRVLQHPHITEQPFTRSLSGIDVPSGITEVIVVAGCTVDGINSKKFAVKL